MARKKTYNKLYETWELRCKKSKQEKISEWHTIIILFAFSLSFFASSVIAQKTNEAVKEGNDAYRKNDYTTAIKSYEKALQLDDKNSAAKFNMANALQKANNTDKAASDYDDVIANTNDIALQSKAYYNKALALIQENKLDEAIDAFKKSLRLSPNDNETRENLQKALETKKQKQPQQQPKPDKKQPPQNQKQQKQQQMNQQMMDQKFKELEQQEKELQKELQKQKTTTNDNEKDW